MSVVTIECKGLGNYPQHYEIAPDKKPEVHNVGVAVEGFPSGTDLKPYTLRLFKGMYQIIFGKLTLNESHLKIVPKGFPEEKGISIYYSHICGLGGLRITVTEEGKEYLAKLTAPEVKFHPNISIQTTF